MLRKVFKRIIPRQFHQPISRFIWKRKLLSPYRSPDIPQATWEKEYAEGRWSCLEDLNELTRYSVIAGYCATHKPDSAILDLGCGTGILAQHLSPTCFSSYLGIDLSEHAIATARQHPRADLQFETGNIETFSPQRTYDILIFNEILNYLKDPRKTLLRYAERLAPDGIMIVSIFTGPGNFAIWKLIDGFAPLQDAVSLTNIRTDQSWIVKAYSSPASVKK